MIRSGVLCITALFFLVFTSLAMAELVPYRAAIDEDGVQRVEVVGGGYFYKPDHIVVKVKVPVELKVSKEGGIIPHDFVIDAPDAGIAVKESLSGEPKVVRFTPTKVGKYPFYCSKKPPFFKSHRDKGMEGVLEVVE
ncbi:MAG: cupredoxin domain-containing protein [Geobacteraceae bacterium]|jgi:plastocyanin